MTSGVTLPERFQKVSIMDTPAQTADVWKQRLGQMIHAEATSKQSTIMQYPN